MSREAIQQFEDLIEVTDVGEAFRALGMTYAAFEKSLNRNNRKDLLPILREWKAKDTDRLLRARGERWT